MAEKTRVEQLRAADIKMIKMGQAALGLDDDTYRELLARLCDGKRSATALTWQERQKVIAHMKANGLVVKPRRATERVWDDTMPKLRALWYALADAGAVKRPGNTTELDMAIEAWARRMQPEISTLRMASGYQMQRLVEAAKRWGVRVGAQIKPQPVAMSATRRVDVSDPQSEE